MENLSDSELLAAYELAKEKKLDEEFIELLQKEIKRRGL